MKFARYMALLLIGSLVAGSCEKNTISKIPHITLIEFYPDTSIRANLDTAYIVFSFIDGDADIGNDTTSRVFLKDSRYPAQGFIGYDFPQIDGAVEDPKKGLQGKCLFLPLPQPTPRTDSFHMKVGDTVTYEFYITDRAGDSSNHIITHPLVIKP